MHGEVRVEVQERFTMKGEVRVKEKEGLTMKLEECRGGNNEGGRVDVDDGVGVTMEEGWMGRGGKDDG